MKIKFSSQLIRAKNLQNLLFKQNKKVQKNNFIFFNNENIANTINSLQLKSIPNQKCKKNFPPKSINIKLQRDNMKCVALNFRYNAFS